MAKRHHAPAETELVAAHVGVPRDLMRAGVAWHLCDGCGLPWPFPMGVNPETAPMAHAARDWRCHGCVQRDWAAVQRSTRTHLNDCPRSQPCGCSEEGSDEVTDWGV